MLSEEKKEIIKVAIKAIISEYGLFTDARGHIDSYVNNNDCEKLSVMTKHAQAHMNEESRKMKSRWIRQQIILYYALFNNLDQREVDEKTATADVEPLLVSLCV